MTETPDMASPSQPQTASAAPVIRVLNQFIKDLSFENPGASVQEQPNIELGIDVGATPKADAANTYEVVLKLQARAGTKETALFILELDYAGLFQVEGLPAETLEQVLLIECPRILFPFARRIIADISSEGGFPPLRIDPVDFAALYNTQKQRAAAAQQAQAAAAPETPSIQI